MPERSSSHRLRIGRFCESNRIYLLTANTLHRVPVFKNHDLGRLVANQFQQAQADGLADTLAWVVMPDHFHWLVQLQKGTLGELMCQTKSLSTRAINKTTDRTGSLWQQGSHDRALRQEENLVQMARYVVANPLCAGLVQKLDDYPLWDAIWASR
ncbi:transposase [Pseudomonas sp. Choline-02u-1]|jgi:putative transposase|uniref:REP-associated tyrosine transposase n=1 Tax=unclassified Pseudomonas TaxID=196821 RepID=UPI000C32C192|nr:MULTISPECIES: transposase [unclassified Pseudomonas]PKH80114.1 transposase [Pseudomonas sp. Choline-02u-1]